MSALSSLVTGIARAVFLPHTLFRRSKRQKREPSLDSDDNSTSILPPEEKSMRTTFIRREFPFQTQEELEIRILQLWKKVWFGLYQANAPNGPFHYDVIRALYHGAGLSDSLDREGEIHSLNRLYFRINDFTKFDVHTGITDMKFYANLSSEIRLLVIAQLEAYEGEIVHLQEASRVLREAQVDPGEPAPNALAVKQRYLDIVKPLGERLALYDSKMAWLKKEMHDEAMVIHQDHPHLKTGYFVYERVFTAPASLPLDPNPLVVTII